MVYQTPCVSVRQTLFKTFNKLQLFADIRKSCVIWQDLDRALKQL